ALLPIHADVSIPGLGVAREDLAKRNEPAGVLGPALDDRKLGQVDVVPGLNYLLAWTQANDLSRDAAQPRQYVNHLELVTKAFVVLGFDDFGDSLGYFLKVFDSQGLGHSPLRAENIDGQRVWRAAHFLKQQGGTVGFADPVGDLADFQDRIDFGA